MASAAVLERERTGSAPFVLVRGVLRMAVREEAKAEGSWRFDFFGLLARCVGEGSESDAAESRLERAEEESEEADVVAAFEVSETAEAEAEESGERVSWFLGGLKAEDSFSEAFGAGLGASDTVGSVTPLSSEESLLYSSCLRSFLDTGARTLSSLRFFEVSGAMMV